MHSIHRIFIYSAILVIASAGPLQTLRAEDPPISTEDDIRSAIDTLNRSIADNNTPMRNKMYFKFRLIEQEKPGVVAPFLIENLKTDQDGVPEYTAFILGWIGDKRAIQPLRDMLKGSTSKKEHAMRALGFMQANEAFPDISGLLSDSDPRVRQTAAYSLGLLGDDQAVPLLQKAKEDADELVRFFAEEAIERIDNYKKFGW